MQIRPTLMLIKLGYALGLAVLAAGLIFLLPSDPTSASIWPAVIPGVAVIAFVVVRHIRRNLIRLSIEDDRLRYEVGLLAKSTRTMELVKVQDVRVDQSLVQRMFGLGNLSLETAGETSRITIANIDGPQRAADHILDLARSQRAAQPGQ